MDETYFLFSEKGKRSITERKPRKRGGKSKLRGISNDQVCVLVARDRQKMTYSGVLGLITDLNLMENNASRAFTISKK
jgi:hypothetical protein